MDGETIGVARTFKFAVLALGWLILGSVWRPAAAQAESPARSEAEFAKSIAERIARATGAKVEPAGRLSLRLSKEGAEPLVANLDRIWSACQRVPDRCAAFSDEYVAGVASVVAERTRPPERQALRLAVRPKAFLEMPKSGDAAKSPIVRPYLGDLALVLVFDGGRTIHSASARDLDTLKLTEAEAISLARQNLLARELKPLQDVLKPISGNAIGYLEENAYESSRMVLHDEWKAYAEQIGGNLVIAVPATHVLLYGKGDTSAAVAALRGLAAEVARKNQRPLSTMVFRWQPDGWEVVP